MGLSTRITPAEAVVAPSPAAPARSTTDQEYRRTASGPIADAAAEEEFAGIAGAYAWQRQPVQELVATARRTKEPWRVAMWHASYHCSPVLRTGSAHTLACAVPYLYLTVERGDARP
jgi:hypothetical protein